MEQDTPLSLLVVIVIQTQAYRSDGGMHDKACHTGEVDLLDFLVHNRFLIGPLLDRFKGLEEITLQSEVQLLSKRKHVSPAAGNEIKRPEIFQQ